MHFDSFVVQSLVLANEALVFLDQHQKQLSYMLVFASSILDHSIHLVLVWLPGFHRRKLTIEETKLRWDPQLGPYHLMSHCSDEHNESLKYLGLIPSGELSSRVD
jgi:hypothetical protein